MTKFNKFFLIKLLENIYIYNFINNIDITKNKIDYIF